MLNATYVIFFEPLEYLMRLILEAFVSGIGSYGIALILLSITVNALTIPIYRLVEQWQQKEAMIKARLAPKINEIKAVFEGQERYMMLKTLYRQNQYHPFMSLRTSFGFMIQIPFFFIAFHFIGNYVPLEGQSFLIFKDLGQEDGILNVAGNHLNIMPFVMTFINVIAITIQANKISKSQRYQLYTLSGIFLVLLYNSPVALILYWTTTNIFALVKFVVIVPRNFNRKCFKAIQKTEASIISYLNTRAQNLTINATSKKLRLLLFLIFCLLNLPISNASDLYLPKDIIFILFFNFTIIVTIYYMLIAMKNFLVAVDHKFEDKLFIVFISYLVINTCFHVYEHLKTAVGIRDTIINILNIEFNLILIMFIFLIKIINPKCPKISNGIYWKISISSVVFIFLGILLTIAIKTLFSDTEIFEHNYEIILIHIIKLAIWFVIFSICIIKLTPSAYRFLLCFALTGGALLIFSYANLFTIETGVFDFNLVNLRSLRPVSVFFYDCLIFIGICFLLYFIFKRGHERKVYHFFTVGILVTVFFNVYQISDAGIPNNNYQQQKAIIPDYNDKLLSFSKEGTNVVVLMLDMFTGGLLDQMLKEYPELYTDLDGFTWYPNTLSAANKTYGGEPSILGGHYYTPIQINQRASESISVETAKGFINFSKAFVEKDYAISVANTYTVDCTTINSMKIFSYPINCLNTKYDYLNYWKKVNHFTSSNSLPTKIKIETIASFIAHIALFNVVPFKLRSYIYDGGRWLGVISFDDMGHNHVKEHFSFLDSMSLVSNSNSHKNTFKYIRSKVTHFPYTMDKKSCWHNNIVQEHFDVSYCAIKSIVKWIDWMKKENVYDNTLFIIVSDHGGHDSPLIPIAVKKEHIDKLYGRERSSPHALMMVKGLSERHPLNVSDDFLSNADTPAIACVVIGGCENIIKTPLKYPVLGRELDYSLITGFGKSKYDILLHYKVKSNIFEPQNWKQIDQ